MSFGSKSAPAAQNNKTQEWPNSGQTEGPRPSSTSRNAVSVLILGRSGSGKTLFVDAACSGAPQARGRPSSKTTKAASFSTYILNQEFSLIDTPGFDSTATSDVEVFVELAGYLSDNKRAEAGVAGVIYIHRAGDSLESRALTQNIKVLSEVFLGEAGLSRLTVLVVPDNSRPLNSASAVKMITHASSALRPLFPTKHHKILVSNFDRVDISSILMAYADKKPVVLRVQQDSLKAPQFNLLASVEARLGYCEYESMRVQLEEQERRHRTQISGLQALLPEASVDILKQTEQQLRDCRGEIAAMRHQLQQTQSEYASLRSQFNLQENIEQSEIVQCLTDLNRDIENIGQSISGYLVDNYVQAAFDKDPVEVTALDAHNLHDLKILLGHVDGSPSLISFSSGVFSPFHPGVDSLQNDFANEMYADVQLREPQTMAARWRASTFKSIYKPNHPGAASQHVDRISQGFLLKRLGPLITNFFGRDTEVAMLPRHYERVQRLVQTAWDWNTTLKGEVIMLGDFRLMAFPPSSTFDPTLMNEFESNLRQPPATSVLATIGLGLISSIAVGGGRPPEITVVYKTLVATQSRDLGPSARRYLGAEIAQLREEARWK
ncbi:hypothetical protein BDV93DRAFT_553238 [Ceratobasidium sp. AG-I]|nr:hypothetical protein BDV93DRAFT_553238 [Ceratobasidium sp. AG-I]